VVVERRNRVRGSDRRVMATIKNTIMVAPITPNASDRHGDAFAPAIRTAVAVPSNCCVRFNCSRSAELGPDRASDVVDVDAALGSLAAGPAASDVGVVDSDGVSALLPNPKPSNGRRSSGAVAAVCRTSVAFVGGAGLGPPLPNVGPGGGGAGGGGGGGGGEVGGGGGGEVGGGGLVVVVVVVVGGGGGGGSGS
jgi:hypothetical protein